MTKKALLVLMCFMSMMLFTQISHSQSAKKTLTLPNGEVVLDLSGDWDVIVENYGPWSFAGTYPLIVRVKQTGSSIVGTRLTEDPYHHKGSDAIQGKVGKEGFDEVYLMSAHGPLSAEGKISEDGNKMVIDNGERARATYTRK